MLGGMTEPLSAPAPNAAPAESAPVGAAAPHPTAVRPRRGPAETGGVLLAYTLLTVLMTWPLATVFTTRLPDGTDGWQYLWNLWWMKTALVDLHTSPFHTPYLYYPYGVSLYFDTLTPLLGVISIPLQLAGLTLPTIYNLLVGFSFVGAGYGTYLLVRHLTGDRRAAFVAGLIFAFCPYHFAHLRGHLNLVSLQWLPFYVLALLHAWEPHPSPDPQSTIHNPQWAWAVVAGVWLAVTAYTEWMYALFLGLFTVWFAAWRLVRPHPQPGWRVSAGLLGVSGGVALALVSPVLVPMLQEARAATYMQASPEELRFFSSDLTDALLPNLFHPLWPDRGLAVFLHYLGRPPAELVVFAGYTVLLLSLGAVWRCRHRPEVVFWAWTALGAWVLSLGPTLHIWGHTDFGGWSVPLPYTLLEALPFASIFWVPARLMVLTMLALAVLAGYALAALAAGGGRGRAARWARPPLLTGGIGMLILAEFLPVPYPLLPLHAETPFYQEVAREPGRFALLELPLVPAPTYLGYQVIHQQPLISGHLSRQPPDPFVAQTPVLRYLLPQTPLDDPGAAEAARTGLADLRRAAVRYAVVHWWLLGSEDQATLRAKLARVFPALPTHPSPDPQMEIFVLAP
jgi:hypothetical protein